MRIIWPILSLLAIACLLQSAETPQIPWQSRLTNASGTALTGSHVLRFTIADASNNTLWDSGDQTMTVADGLVALVLGGSATPALPASVSTMPNTHISVTIDGQPFAGTVPIVPAVRALAVPDGSVGTATLADGSVTAAKLAAGAINASAISGTVPIANGGTSATTASAALANLLPAQTSHVGQVLTTDGTAATWQALPASPSGLLPWVVVNGGYQMAQPNKGYILNSAFCQTIELSNTFQVGDVIRFAGGIGGGAWGIKSGNYSILGVTSTFAPIFNANPSTIIISDVTESDDGSKILLSTVNHTSWDCALYLSCDHGVTWSLVASRQGGYLTTFCFADGALMFYVYHPNSDYSGASDVLYRSTNNGVNWTPVFTGPGWYVNVDANKGLLVTKTSQTGPSTPQVSSDGGATWNPGHVIGSSGETSSYFDMSPDGLRYVVQTTQQDSNSPSFGSKFLYVSSGDAQAWTPVQMPAIHQGATSITVAPLFSDSGDLLIFSCESTPGTPSATYSTYIYRTANQGVTWSLVATMPTGYNDMPYHTRNRRHIMATCSGLKKIYFSNDGGISWLTMDYPTGYWPIAIDVNGSILARFSTPQSLVLLSSPAIWCSLTSASTLEMLYVGNNQFTVLSSH